MISEIEYEGNTIFQGAPTKQGEHEHYHFLNEMRKRLGVDEEKIIDLEARISCKYPDPRKLITGPPPYLVGEYLRIRLNWQPHLLGYPCGYPISNLAYHASNARSITLFFISFN